MGGSDYHERITTMTAATLNVVCRDDVDESGAKVWSGLVHAAFLEMPLIGSEVRRRKSHMT